jgi:hypothetical protein
MAPLARPLAVGFGIRVDGRDAGISFSTVADAEGGAHRLSAQGYKQVDIFERLSGRVVEYVSPRPSEA